jgi:hypothetical protein
MAVALWVYSLSLPFVALTSNVYNTLETRNGAMFVPYKAGTTMLLHIGCGAAASAPARSWH